MYNKQTDEYDIPEPSYADSSEVDLLHDLALARQWLADDIARGWDTKTSQEIITEIEAELARRNQPAPVNPYQLSLFATQEAESYIDTLPGS